jgi:hypothetical protein
VNADEDRNLGELLELLDRTGRPWGELIDTPDAWQVQEGSPLAEDDARTAPYQLSHSAWHALTVAVDHLRCLQSSLVGEVKNDSASIRIHTHTQFSLVRGAIENGARTVWMVGPAGRLTRVTHRLSLEAAELSPSYRLRELVRKPPPRTREERQEELRRTAIAAGVPDADVKKALKSAQYNHIVREAGELIPSGADVAEAVWRGCSALAHGDISGTLGLPDREVVETSDGVNTVRITGSIGLLYWFTGVAALMIDRGFKLYQQNATR